MIEANLWPEWYAKQVARDTGGKTVFAKMEIRLVQEAPEMTPKHEARINFEYERYDDEKIGIKVTSKDGGEYEVWQWDPRVNGATEAAIDCLVHKYNGENFSVGKLKMDVNHATLREALNVMVSG